MSRDSRGRFYVTYATIGHGPELVAIFDSTGKPLGEIGRKGNGPGEYIFPVTVNVGPRDELYIWDFNGSAETILDRDHKFVRRARQLAATNAVLQDGRRVVGTSALDIERRSAPLSIVDSLGKTIVGFGASTTPPIGSDPWRINRKVGLGPQSTIWVARPDEYRLERWDATGRFQRAFTRSVPWFPPVVQASVLHRGERPTPDPQVLFENSSGQLWYFVSVAAANWRNALGPARSVAGRPNTYPQHNRSKLFETMIDVIDVQSRTVLGSQRVPAWIKFALGDNLVASYRQDDEGNPFIDIWRVRLQR